MIIFFNLFLFINMTYTTLRLQRNQHLKDVFAFLLINMRPHLTFIRIEKGVFSVFSDHQLLLRFLFLGVHMRVGNIHFLKGLDHIIKVRGEKEVSIGFIFFAKEKQEHESFQLFSILLPHITHNIEECFVLSCYGFVLLHENLHHALKLFML